MLARRAAFPRQLPFPARTISPGRGARNHGLVTDAAKNVGVCGFGGAEPIRERPDLGIVGIHEGDDIGDVVDPHVVECGTGPRLTSPEEVAGGEYPRNEDARETGEEWFP